MCVGHLASLDNFFLCHSSPPILDVFAQWSQHPFPSQAQQQLSYFLGYLNEVQWNQPTLGSFEIKSWALAILQAWIISSFETPSLPYLMFCSMEQLNRIGSWLTTPIFSLTQRKFRSVISLPSIRIYKNLKLCKSLHLHSLFILSFCNLIFHQYMYVYVLRVNKLERKCPFTCITQ